MKRQLFAAVLVAAAFGGPLSASSVIDCSGTAGAINSCVASQLPTFQTQLDLAMLGQPFSGSLFGSATATGVLPGNDLTVSGYNLESGEGLRLGYNFGTVLVGSNWLDPGLVPGAGHYFPGHFNASSSSGTLSALQNDPAIQLLGLRLDGTAQMGAMLLDFTNPFGNLGFYVGSAADNGFNVRIQVFAGAGASGAQLADVTFNYGAYSLAGVNGPGGTCSTMQSAPFAPTGCNDAPFIYASGFNTGLSVLISTTDQDGFYLNQVQVGAIPEPGTMVLCGCGIALVAFGALRSRRKA